MEERSIESIKTHLQREDAQERIRQSIKHARAEATVTIGRMAQLFDMRESRIRDLETKGLLSPWRSKDISGQRQFSQSELEKLAVIKELLEQGRFSSGDIPENLTVIWKEIARVDEAQSDQLMGAASEQDRFVREADTMPIDRRGDHIYYRELYWRYYASHALYLALTMIYEETRFTRAGLVLPLKTTSAYKIATDAHNLPRVGESLVGWLGQSHSFYTFLAPAPSVQYPDVFNVLPLRAIEEGNWREDQPKDNTLLVLPRLEVDEHRLQLSVSAVELIRRLLEPLYTEVPDWDFYLGHGMRDVADPFLDINTNPNGQDIIETNLANTIISLGGTDARGQPRWKFCVILTPDKPHLPFQQRSLVIRAKSRHAPSLYKVGTTLLSPTDPVISMSMRAYQAGRVMYHHRVTEQDKVIAYRELENPGSAIALPVGGETLAVGGENVTPAAVIYIAAAEPDGFNESDQRLLRVVARIVQELVISYRTRTRLSQDFSLIFRNPRNVDPTFNAFSSETDFIDDAEMLLQGIQGMEDLESYARDDKRQYSTTDAVSFIAIDMDRQTSIADKYGGRMARNLSRAVGERILRQMPALFPSVPDWKLYHIYADRYYIMLNGVSLEEARTKAHLLKQALDGSYPVDFVRFTPEQPTPKENLVASPEITVRLGISIYTYVKLQELLSRYPQEVALSATTEIIIGNLDGILKLGQDKGGNNIVSWDYEEWGWIPW